MVDKKAATRKANQPIKVYCLPEEKAEIQAKADAAGLSLSTYLLRVGQGYKIDGILDHHRIQDLAKVNGDLGRLGGLLKLWLTDDQRTAEISTAKIRAVLANIEDSQDVMREIMKKVIKA